MTNSERLASRLFEPLRFFLSAFEGFFDKPFSLNINLPLVIRVILHVLIMKRHREAAGTPEDNNSARVFACVANAPSDVTTVAPTFRTLPPVPRCLVRLITAFVKTTSTPVFIPASVSLPVRVA